MTNTLGSFHILFIIFLLATGISCDSLTGADGKDGEDGKDGISAPVPDFSGSYIRTTIDDNQSRLFIGLKGTWQISIFNSEGSSVYANHGTYDWTDSDRIHFSDMESHYGTFEYHVDSKGDLTLTQNYGYNIFNVADSERWSNLLFEHD